MKGRVCFWVPLLCLTSSLHLLTWSSSEGRTSLQSQTTAFFLHHSETAKCLEQENDEVPPIPVLGVGVTDDPMSFLTRLYYSIDFPVEHLVLVVGGESSSANVQADHIEGYPLSWVKRTTVVRKEVVTSCAEHWNTILKAQPEGPWYLVVNYDVLFLPGALRNASLQFGRALQNGVEFAQLAFENMEPKYSAFAIAASLIPKAGYFDENLYPAYFEDDDYGMRLTRLGTKQTILWGTKLWHGRLFDREYRSGMFAMSESYTKRVFASWEWNAKYVANKWGCDLVPHPAVGLHLGGNCSFSHPWNKPYLSVSAWRVDPERMKDLVARYDDEFPLE